MQNGDTKISARRRNANIAYACYLWVAVVLLISMTLQWVFGSPQTSEELASFQGLGMLVILPLSLAAIVAAIFGFESSLKLWTCCRREAGLLILPLLLLVLLGIFALAEADKLGRTWLALAAVLYSAAAIAFALHWFVSANKRVRLR